MLQRVTAEIVESLRSIPGVGSTVSTNPVVCQQHGQDESWHAAQAPDAVCFPSNTDEVAAVMKICAAARVPLIAFGAGSAMEGQVTAPMGGVCLDMSRMNTVLQINAEDRDCTVQAGVTRLQLNDALRHTGLIFPIDPGANATIGGMVSTRASGTTTIYYGTMAEAVLYLTVVLADGRIIKTGTRAPKSSAGYDLTRLFVGAEGTLGVITEVALRLHPRPEYYRSVRVQFETVAQCTALTIEAIQCGLPVTRIELLDSHAIAAVNGYCGTDYSENPMLFIEFYGTQAATHEQMLRMSELCTEHGGQAFASCENEEQRSEMWQARHNMAYAARASRRGSEVVPTDVCVPVSRLADCIAEAQALAEAHTNVPTVLVGHVGDGNFHLAFVVDPQSPQELEAVKAVNAMIVASAIRMGGSCTGEHGIGLGKKQSLVDELGVDTVDVMKSLKYSLDPEGILNPGKIFL